MVFNNKYDQKWEEKFDLLVEYINSSKENKREFERKGGISTRTILEKNGKKIQLGSWLNQQKENMMRKYDGMTIEQIENDETIPDTDKYRMKKLLGIGVKYSIRENEKRKIWDKNFDLLEKYINSSENIKKEFLAKGTISKDLVIEHDGKKVLLGKWFETQRSYFQTKYKNMDLEQIMQDENVPKDSKYKIQKLLNIGIKFNINEEKWNQNFELLEELINSSDKVRAELKRTGKLSSSKELIAQKNGKKISIAYWLRTQRFEFMKKYQGMSIEEIRESKSIPEDDKYKMIKLLELGVSYLKTEEKGYDEQWEERYELLKQYINSTDKLRKYFDKKGTIPTNSIVYKDGIRIDLRKWLVSQKYYLIELNDGKNIDSIEEILNNKKLSEIERNKAIKLFNLGVQFKIREKINGQDIGKVSFTSSVKECDIAEEIIIKAKLNDIEKN